MFANIIFLIFIITLYNTIISVVYEEFTDDDYNKFQSMYVEEADPEQKAHLDVIIKPEKFDLNKDRKISKEEIKKAINYVIYPKDEKRKKNITEEIHSHVQGQLDLFITNLDQNYFTFKQFSKLMSTISSNNFVHHEILRRTIEAKKQRRESEEEL